MSLLSPETVARIESWMMDPLEIYACIFLLYEQVDTALEHICLEIQTCRRYQPVLDSVLFQREVFHEGPLTKWSKYAAGKGDPHWQDRLLEALMIIKDFRIVKYLNASMRDLEIKFLPSQVNTSYHIDLVRKVLYLLAEDLTKDEWSKLRQLIIAETKLKAVSTMFTEIPECFMLYLMSKNFIQIKKQNQTLNLSLLVRCLKAMEKYYWADQLKSIEKLDRGSFNVENDVKNVVSKKIPSQRFNLDHENQGTILIINVVDYCEKTVTGISLGKRTGSDVDEERLLGTFDLLGFKSTVIFNPAAEEIISIIRESLEKFCLETKKSKQVRCFAVAILAHGDKDGFYCSKGELVSWDSVRAELRQPNTKDLPRLLLIQACKGTSQVTKSPENIEEDGVGSETDSDSKNLKDLFELSSSVSGFAAYRSTLHGSFFLRSFCKHILQFGSDCDLNHIITLINKDLDSKEIYCRNSKHPVSMTAELTGTPLKLLYLSVPQNQKQKAENLIQQWDYVEKTECKRRDQHKFTLYPQKSEDEKSKALEDEIRVTKSNQKEDETSEETGEEEHEEASFQFDDLKKLALKIGGEKSQSNVSS